MATHGNMSVVALNLEKGFFAVATYWCKYFSICEVRWFEEGYGIDITEWFVQMLGKKKPARNSDIFSSLFTVCLQPAVADFVPELDQISLSFRKFNFDTK